MSFYAVWRVPVPRLAFITLVAGGHPRLALAIIIILISFMEVRRFAAKFSMAWPDKRFCHLNLLLKSFFALPAF